MTNAAALEITLQGRDVGLASLLTSVNAATEKAANSALALQAQYARLAAAQGNTGQATAILSNALLTNGGASEKAIVGVATQLTTLQTGFSTTGSMAQQFGASAASSLLGMVGPAALASAAIGGLAAVGKSFVDAFQFKTQLDQSTASIKILLQGVRDSGEVFAGAARFAATYKLTQQETTDAIQSSIPVIRNSKASIEDVLGVFARLKVLKPEKTFGDAARALGELQAGQIVSIVDQFNLSRTAANKMKDEIAKGGDAVQVLSNYLTSAGVGMDALAVQTQGAAGRMRELAQAQEQLKLAQAAFAQGPGMVILDQQIRVTSGATRLLTGDFGAMGASLGQVGSSIGASAGSLGVYLSALASGKSTTEAAAAAQASYQTALTDTAASWQSSGGAALQAGVAYDTDRIAIGQLQIATDNLVAANAAAIGAMGASAATSVADSAAKQAQAAITALLQEQTTVAANAFLSLNPNISQSGVAAAQASGQISAAVGTYIQMTIATANARNQLAQLQAQAGLSPAVKAFQARNPFLPITRTDLADPAEGAANVARLKVLTAQEQAHADAVRAATVANGTAAEKQALYNRELQTATRVYGANSTEAIKAKTALDSYEASQDKKKAGGSKVSAAQKEQTALAQDQFKADTSAEDAETAHRRRLVDIYTTYAEKMKQEQDNLNQSQLDTAASFYDQLGGVGSAKLRASSSAEYEGAVKEAAAMGGEAGQKYLEAKEAVILARAKRAADIEAATAKGDTGAAAYQTGVDKLYRASEDAKLKRIKQGGDAAATERDTALADEQQKYDEANGKIATAAERSAERRAIASSKAGAAVDAEQTKLNTLAATYEKLGPRAPGTASAASASPATPATPGTATAAPTPENDPIVSALQSAQAAIVGALASVEKATRGVGSAVSGLQGKMVQ